MMLVLGRLSLKMVWPELKTAGPFPVLGTAMDQVQGVETPVVPLTLFVLVAVRSGAVTVTVLLQALLLSLLSVTLLLGSTEQEPIARGLANVPIALGVALNCTPKAPVVAAITTDPPLAVQVRSELVMLQLIVPLPVIPLEPTMLVAP